MAVNGFGTLLDVVNQPDIAPQGQNILDPLAKTSLYLRETGRIGAFKNHHYRYRRCIDLKKQEIFNSLVNLYRLVMQSYWPMIMNCVDPFPDLGIYQADPPGYAAACYISGWFHDLYVVNRLVCQKVSNTTCTRYYFIDIVHKSMEWDLFLCRLIDSIRPTNIKQIHEDTLYIPLITRVGNPNASDGNYFHIHGWVSNEPCLTGIIYTLRNLKLLKFDKISDSITGRPCWLFDWHDEDLACAWFPAEHNYTFEDVTLALIIGEACSTQELAPRDYDEWQMFPGNIHPQVIAPFQYQRIRPIAYHGDFTSRRLEIREWNIPDDILALAIVGQPPQVGQPTAAPPALPHSGHASQRKRRRTTTAQSSALYALRNQPPQVGTGTSAEPAIGIESITDSEGEGEIHECTFTNTPAPPPVHFPAIRQFRIVDFIYYARVVINNDIPSRFAALKMITSPGL